MFDIKSMVLQALYSLPGIIVGLSFHEWGHAYAAYKRGDPTARNLGRMTVNPLAHIDPIGFITLLIFRFGWAKPVPINTRNFKNPRKDEIIVSLAGITVNLAIGALSMLLLYVLITLGVANEIIYYLIWNCAVINFSLMVFNLLPVPPLDGYRVVKCVFINQKNYRIFSQLESYGRIILIAALIFFSRTGILSGLIGLIMSPFMRLSSMIAGLI